MGAAKHTPGRISVGQLRNQRADARLQPMHEAPIHVGDPENRGNCIAIVYCGGPGAIHSDANSVFENARRLAACWNALDGIDTAVVESMAEDRSRNKAIEWAELIAQRDELLAALEHVEAVYRLNVVKEGEPSSTLANLQAVIAKATGQEGGAA